MITCLMGGGSFMTGETCETLYRHALTMYSEKIKRRNFATHSCAGFITSEFEYVTLETFGGFVFTATLETDQGTKTVKYLVRAQDMSANEDGIWFYVSAPRSSMVSSTPASSMLN